MSHLVAILTIEQKDSLVGQKYDSVSYWNPTQDCNDDWVISSEEISENVYSEFDWTKQLTLTDFCPKPTPPRPMPDTGTTDNPDFMGS